MTDFKSQLERMKSLYTYGTVNEDKKNSNYTLEYHATAADGKEYGIIKECNHYYIKTANQAQKLIAESYQYIGGWNNKKNYQYDSYANALKNLELKMSSINEAHDSKVDITTLDPFKKENLVIEATDKMKNEIARQRQIMYNASMIMNESCDYAVKGGKACNCSQPEAEKGAKGDKIEGSKDTKAEPEYNGKKVELNKKAEPFKENPVKGVNEGCEGGSCETDFDEGLKQSPKDPAQIAWDIDGQKKVNEEADEKFSEGLPNSAGVGDADTKENNMPFEKKVNEGCCEGEEDNDVDNNVDNNVDNDIDSEGDVDTEDNDVDIEDNDVDIEDNDVDTDSEGDDMSAFEDDDFDSEIENDSDSYDDDNEFPSTEEGEELGSLVDDDEDIMSQIEALKAQLASLEAKVSGEDEYEIDSDDDFEGEDNFADEGGEDDFGSDDDFDSDNNFEGEDDFDSDDDFEGEDNFADEGGEDVDNFADEGGEDVEDDDMDYDYDQLPESKKRHMNSIIESVVKGLLKEDELHDFGKHPGYRKKPMNLPPTGEDKNEHGRDWNDESCHNEEPFGKKIGSSFPFQDIVNAVTKDVQYQLKQGIPMDKKKVE